MVLNIEFGDRTNQKTGDQSTGNPLDMHYGLATVPYNAGSGMWSGISEEKIIIGEGKKALSRLMAKALTEEQAKTYIVKLHGLIEQSFC